MTAPIPSTTHKGGPFGVCAAIGADFGFNPDIIRITLAAGLLWNLPAVVAAYGFAALLMLAGRMLFPGRAERPERPKVAETIVEDRPISVSAPMERLAA